MSTLVQFHMVTQKPLWFASGRVSCAKNLPNWIYKAAYCAYNSISLSLILDQVCVNTTLQCFQERISLQISPMVKLCNAQRHCNKNPSASSQTLQASIIMFRAKVHDSTLRKRLNMYGLFGCIASKTGMYNTFCQLSSMVMEEWWFCSHMTEQSMTFSVLSQMWGNLSDS